MKITTQPSAVVISDIAEMTAGTSPEVREQVRRALTGTPANLELDCAALTFIDSSGLGTLISMQKLAAQHGGSFQLRNVKPNIMQVLELTRLHRVLDILPA